MSKHNRQIWPCDKFELPSRAHLAQKSLLVPLADIAATARAYVQFSGKPPSRLPPLEPLLLSASVAHACGQAAAGVSASVAAAQFRDPPAGHSLKVPQY